MRKVLIFLVAVFLLGGAVTAQADKPDLDVKREMFWSQIDAKTEWGKWLLTQFRPYSDETSRALLLLSPDKPGGKPQYQKCFEALRAITPPPELKTFHTKQLALFAIASRDVPPNAGEINRQNAVLKKLSDEMTRELVRVLNAHGVPQNVVDDFTKNL